MPIENRLRGLDHDLEAERSLWEAERRFHRSKQARERSRLLGDHHLGQGDDEVLRQASARGFAERTYKEIERTNAAGAQLRRERLEANADERRKTSGGESLGHFFGGEVRVMVLSGI